MSLVNSFGNMRPMSLDIANENGEPHWLYDLSIDDVEVRKKKRQWFAAAHKLANYLGVPPKDVFDKRVPGTKIFYRYTLVKHILRRNDVFDKRVPGTKIFSKRFQRWYAIRIVT